MNNMIEKFIKNMTMNDVKNFALKKGANLSESELQFTYNFIKTNYKQILSNPQFLNIERYKDKYSKENFAKIKQVFQEYYQKYGRYL